MTQTTVTLTREVVQQALDALEGLFKSKSYDDQSGGVAVWRLGGSHEPKLAITALRAALDTPEDRSRAVREAVLMVAAEIGRAMP